MRMIAAAVLALALVACKTTSAPKPTPTPTPVPMCEHPCDVLNGVEPARQVSCQFAAKISGSCVKR